MKKGLIIFIVLFVFGPALVSASGVEEFFQIFDSMEEIIELYKEHHIGIDFFLYMLIFGSVLNATVSKKLGKGATVGLAIVFSIAMVVFAQQQGFMIGDFWFIALIILAAVFLSFIYRHLPQGKSVSEKWLFIAIGYLAVYIGIRYMEGNVLPELYYEYEWLYLFLEILAIVVVVWLAVKFINFLNEKQDKPDAKVKLTNDDK